jgi:hypothetical protein
MAYIEKVLERFQMKDYTSCIAPIIKGEKIIKDHFSQNALEQEQMKSIFYTFVVGSLMYAHVCTKPNIILAVGILGRYQSNLGWNFGEL